MTERQRLIVLEMNLSTGKVKLLTKSTDLRIARESVKVLNTQDNISQKNIMILVTGTTKIIKMEPILKDS